MSIYPSRNTTSKAAYLKPKRTIETATEYRNRLLMAINDAERLGFENTKAALVEMLTYHQASTSSVD